jgi:hypothetical protein
MASIVLSKNIPSEAYFPYPEESLMTSTVLNFKRSFTWKGWKLNNPIYYFTNEHKSVSLHNKLNILNVNKYGHRSP